MKQIAQAWRQERKVKLEQLKKNQTIKMIILHSKLYDAKFLSELSFDNAFTKCGHQFRQFLIGRDYN
jgi:hypothetical protein